MRAMRSLVRPVRIMRRRSCAVSCDNFQLTRVRPEDHVRGVVEIAAAALEQIGQAIDQHLEEPHEGQRRRALLAGAQLGDHRVERR